MEPGGGPHYLEVIGARRLSTGLGDVVEQVNRRQPPPFALNETFDAAGHPEQRFCRSDHYSYARIGIPVASFSTGLHPDYHQVTDEAQYIDYPKLTRVTRFVADVAVALGDLSGRPAIDGPLPDPSAPCRQ